MKRLLLIAIITLSAIAAKAETFLESCEDVKGITTVYVSKAMIAMAGNLNSGDMDLNSLAGKLNSIQIANAEGKNVAALRARTKVFSTSQGYEELVRVREDNENVKILMRKLKPSLYEYVILAEEANELSVIILTGSMTMEDVMASVK